MVVYLYDWFRLRNRDRAVAIARLITGAYFGESREYHTGPWRLQTLLGPSPPDRSGKIDPAECAYLDEYPHVATPRVHTDAGI